MASTSDRIGNSSGSIPAFSEASPMVWSSRAVAIDCGFWGGKSWNAPRAQSNRMSSNWTPRIASDWDEERPVEINRSNRFDASIGIASLASSHKSPSSSNTGMSVSGYILAPPGSGRSAMVVPSSGCPFLNTTFLTSFGILW